MQSLIRYIENLRLTQGRLAGERFRLLPFQRRFLTKAFGQPGDAALSMGRGGGKTTLTAAIAAAAWNGPISQPRAEVLIVASSFDQGRIAYDHLLGFVEPWLLAGPKRRYRVVNSSSKCLLTDMETGSKVRLLGCDPRRMHGAAPVLILADEIAQWPHNLVSQALEALRRGKGKIPGSRMLWIGTRPDSPEHPFSVALEGRGVGYAQCHAARPDDPPFHRRTWKRANPALDAMPDLEAAIREEAAEARRSAAAMAGFRAYRLNQGTSDVLRSDLIELELYREIEGAAEPAGSYVLGIDAGQSAAMSGAAGYWPDTGKLTGLAAFPSIPALSERGLSDGVGRLYVDMEQRGELIQTGQRISDLADLIAECLHRWGVPAAVVADRWRAAELRDALDGAGCPVVPLILRGQGYRDGGEDVRDFRKACLSGAVVPDESLLLRAAFGEARVIGDPSGNWKLSKMTQGGRRAQARDDAAAAAVLAVAHGWRNKGQDMKPKATHRIVG